MSQSTSIVIKYANWEGLSHLEAQKKFKVVSVVDIDVPEVGEEDGEVRAVE